MVSHSSTSCSKRWSSGPFTPRRAIATANACGSCLTSSGTVPASAVRELRKQGNCGPLWVLVSCSQLLDWDCGGLASLPAARADRCDTVKLPGARPERINASS